MAMALGQPTSHSSCWSCFRFHPDWERYNRELIIPQVRPASGGHPVSEQHGGSMHQAGFNCPDFYSIASSSSIPLQHSSSSIPLFTTEPYILQQSRRLNPNAPVFVPGKLAPAALDIPGEWVEHRVRIGNSFGIAYTSPCRMRLGPVCAYFLEHYARLELSILAHRPTACYVGVQKASVP